MTPRLFCASASPCSAAMRILDSLTLRVFVHLSVLPSLDQGLLPEPTI